VAPVKIKLGGCFGSVALPLSSNGRVACENMKAPFLVGLLAGHSSPNSYMHISTRERGSRADVKAPSKVLLRELKERLAHEAGACIKDGGLRID
jgi:hypothetical protein